MRDNRSSLISMRKQAISIPISAAIAAILAASAPVARAESSEPESTATESPAGEPAAQPTVGLDRLLKLPGTATTYEVQEEKKYGGVSRSEWASRFDAVNSDVEDAKQDLSAAQRELDQAASEGGGWSMAPPGASNPEAGPASYELLQKVRSQKEEVAAAERRRTELTVEASLAGVPDDLFPSAGAANVSAPAE